MPTKIVEPQTQLKYYPIQYPLDAYTFPSNALIHQAQLDEKYLRVELLDGRMLAIPLWWIPTLYNAAPEERQKFEISRDRTMLIWDPEKCQINDEVRVQDYLK